MNKREWGQRIMKQTDQLINHDPLKEMKELIFSFLSSKAKSSRKVYRGHLALLKYYRKLSIPFCH
ncbi:MAG: hypothetical protein IEMM0008_0988 [bacterium]|nr:MAG: hypothetical protein IEMM0008_0988 [bacterium]